MWAVVIPSALCHDLSRTQDVDQAGPRCLDETRLTTKVIGLTVCDNAASFPLFLPNPKPSSSRLRDGRWLPADAGHSLPFVAGGWSSQSSQDKSVFLEMELSNPILAGGGGTWAVDGEGIGPL